MSDARLDKIRARLAQSTPGPWRMVAETRAVEGSPYEQSLRLKYGQPLRTESDERARAWLIYPDDSVNDIVSEADGSHVFCPGHDYDEHGHMSIEDASFCAHAREDIPYLLGIIAELSAKN